jgi:hypothetical protein
MEQKRRLLQALKQISPEKADLSVNDIKAMLVNDIEWEDKQIVKREAEVVKEYTDTYLIKRNKCRVFGNTLTLLHIRTLEIGSYNTDWERLYEFEGTELMFSKNHIHEREIDVDEKRMSEETLKSFDKITEHEFRNYQKRYQKFVSLIYDILPTEETDED